MSPSRIPRFPLIAAALLTLVAAILAGLARMGWNLPVPGPWTENHGALMVAGFLGTLIGVERAAGMGSRLAYAAPGLSAAGSVVVLVSSEALLGVVGLVLGSAGLVVLVAVLAVRHPGTPGLLHVLAAVLLLGGNLTWLLDQPPLHAVPLWMGFLVLTIGAERLELSRVRPPSDVAHAALAVALVLFLGGILGTRADVVMGSRMLGGGLALLAAVLAERDVARRTVRTAGLPRYMAAGLLAGYAWLVLAGLLWTGLVPFPDAFEYDAVLHAVFLGFTFSMIFAHAPMIFPGLLGGEPAFSRALYVPLVLLHASLALRVAADAALDLELRRWAAVLNGVAIVAFFPVLAGTARLAASRAGTTGSSPHVRSPQEKV